jgi:hypothetical protein
MLTKPERNRENVWWRRPDTNAVLSDDRGNTVFVVANTAKVESCKASFYLKCRFKIQKTD